MNLTNSQYEQLMGTYYERQIRTKDLMTQRTKEVYSAIPKLKELDTKIRELSMKHAMEALEQRKHSTDLEKEIQLISKEKESLITASGFPSDYLKPVYYCPDCKDTGYIGTKKCHCFEKQIVSFLYSQSGLQEILEKENFSQFKLEYYPDDYIEESTSQTPRDNMRKVYNIAKEFVNNFEQTKDNLLLYGNTGVGKTFLTNCIAKELLDKSNTVVYLTSIKLFDILETYKFGRNLSQTEKDATISYILDCDLLIIDDLGTELNNSFTSSQLYRCIDTRFSTGKSTIISTNLSFEDLREQYSERIFSRITSNYRLLKITGEDIRLKKAIMQL